MASVVAALHGAGQCTCQVVCADSNFAAITLMLCPGLGSRVDLDVSSHDKKNASIKGWSLKLATQKHDWWMKRRTGLGDRLVR